MTRAESVERGAWSVHRFNTDALCGASVSSVSSVVSPGFGGVP